MADHNQLIIEKLQILLADVKKSRNTNDRFRVKAYNNAIRRIKECDHQILSGRDALQLEGIGKKIADKIQEIIDTGTVNEIQLREELKTDLTRQKEIVIGKFLNVWGIGKVKAEDLWTKGARSIKDLETGYNHLLTTNQKVGLRYYQDFQQRIPRDDVTILANRIRKEIIKISKQLQVEIDFRVCGSYRRKVETCGDMDILLSCHGPVTLQKITDTLTARGILKETLGVGATKYLGVITAPSGIGFRCDIEMIKPCEWPFALLYFTGSGRFNEYQRGIAKKMGYSLSEHGLKNIQTGTYVEGINTEQEIFYFLDMTYVQPWERK